MLLVLNLSILPFRQGQPWACSRFSVEQCRRFCLSTRFFTKEPEMVQLDTFCEHTMQQNVTALPRSSS